MKTVEEWLSELPEPYRRVALRYHSNYSKMGKADCLANALVLGFKWSSSKEGSKYWKEVHEMCINDSFPVDPHLPKKVKHHTTKNDIKLIKEVESMLMAKYYPNLDSALEDLYKPINNQTKN